MTAFLQVIISSFLLFLSYPGIDIWPLAFFALIPFFIAVKNAKSLSAAIIYSFLFGLFFYIQILYWLVPTMQAGGVGLAGAVLALIALSAMLSLEFIIPSFAAFFFKKLGCAAWALSLSSAWVLTDFAKTQVNKWMAWFPWFNLAYTQHNNSFLLPYAFHIGVYGFSFLMVYSQSSLAYSAGRNKTFLFKIIFFSAVFSAAAFFGCSRQLSPESSSFKAAIIQPSVELYRKWDEKYREQIMSDNETLALEASRHKPSLIVWPENALPGWINDKPLFDRVSSLARKTSSYHIIGSVSSMEGRHVSAFLVSPEGEIRGEYMKRQLVPFGEYVPFREVLAGRVSALGAMGEFEPGAENQKPFDINGLSAGISICYESVFDYLFYQQKQKGAQVFINITNDGWYFDTLMPRQHLAAAQFRAAENRTPLIRAANSGISAFIDAYGHIISSSGLNEKLYLTADITKSEADKSPLPRYFFVYLSLIIFISFLTARIFI